MKNLSKKLLIKIRNINTIKIFTRFLENSFINEEIARTILDSIIPEVESFVLSFNTERKQELAVKLLRLCLKKVNYTNIFSTDSELRNFINSDKLVVKLLKDCPSLELSKLVEREPSLLNILEIDFNEDIKNLFRSKEKVEFRRKFLFNDGSIGSRDYRDIINVYKRFDKSEQSSLLLMLVGEFRYYFESYT